jgi:glycosyltransferase involved in cell wall biosynthesis
MTLIAVVTPVYNGGKFLAQAMEAVQAQTYRPLIHVVLDNCSTDDTAAIIARYQGRGVPIVTKKNATLLPVTQNWSEAVRMVPAEAAYFKILCADDLMTPDAMAKMTQVALSAEDVRVVTGGERVNGVPQRANLPADCIVFEASNILARVFADGANLFYHHLMYRTDTREPGRDFFEAGMVSFDADAAFRVLARGGRCGVVHEHVFDTIAHEGTLTATWTNKMAAQHWEHLARIERYGPAALSREDYRRVLRRQLLRTYRKLLFLALKGKNELAQRDLERLAGIGRKPTALDLAMSLVAWPGEVFRQRILNRRPHAPWPRTAARPTDKTPRQPEAPLHRNAS